MTQNQASALASKGKVSWVRGTSVYMPSLFMRLHNLWFILGRFSPLYAIRKFNGTIPNVDGSPALQLPPVDRVQIPVASDITQGEWQHHVRGR